MLDAKLAGHYGPKMITALKLVAFGSSLLSAVAFLLDHPKAGNAALAVTVGLGILAAVSALEHLLPGAQRRTRPG
ncbi:hypothetical protein ACFL6C_06200 [Myxococcota bacterium]